MNCNSCKDYQVPFRYSIRVISVIVVLSGLMQLVLGLNIYTTITDPVYGKGWYSGFALVLTGIIGVFVKNRGTAIATWVFTLLSIGVSLFSTGVDCINANTLLTLQTCVSSSNLYNPDIYIYWGNPDFDIGAAICMTNNYDTSISGGQCYCTSSKNYCYPFFGIDNCNTILNQVVQRLNVLCFINTSATCVIFTLSLLVFISLFIHPRQVNETAKEAIKRTQMLLRQQVAAEKVKFQAKQEEINAKHNNNGEMKTSMSKAFENERESSIDFGSDTMNPLSGMNSNPLANK